jgi:hypothetical protein
MARKLSWIRHEVQRHWVHALQRRGQRQRISWVYLSNREYAQSQRERGEKPSDFSSGQIGTSHPFSDSRDVIAWSQGIRASSSSSSREPRRDFNYPLFGSNDCYVALGASAVSYSRAL